MTKIYLILLSILSFGSKTSEDKNTKLPPLEVYIIDQESLPKATGKKGTTYTASVYVVDNTKQQVFGPFKGSSFPNAKEIPKGSDKPSTLLTGIHLFNNTYGHKGGTVKGLNLINRQEKRSVNGFSWFKAPSKVVYANVHAGFSDNGNFNSRGSMGCITIHPKEVDAFWKHFNFSFKTKGTATGVIYIYRANEKKRKQFIEQITQLYE